MAISPVNPYAGYGTVVTGERFVGRENTLGLLHRTVGAGYSSRALVGEPRIGKSSIARLFLDQLSGDRKINASWVDLSSVETNLTLFDAIYDALVETVHLPSLRQAGSSAVPFTGTKELLRSSTADGRRHVMVIDEFDAVRGMESSNLSVRRLRELISRPSDFGLTVLLCCRRRLSSIEKQIPNLSDLVGVCQAIYVKPFTPAELTEMVARRWKEGLPKAEADSLDEIAGGHPFLSEAFLFELAEGCHYEEAIERSRDTLNSYFKKLLVLLEEDDLLQAARDVAVDGHSVPSTELDALIDYGLINRKTSGLALWSAAFAELLSNEARPVDRWSTDA
ncbi:ATP-binding protein [Blastococcus sp. VKM Ac-2987]|uniref:ATP-binding protein n=1 Tax=Blastococcus sp. VKM Ac-2987 TaxID=3004141 RepID=UPI0022ABAB75|nr:ATP-binding protein [Blastococcus sp. VKM Ac-2987]MCZ2857744.1 ATP-binding protein [Blastococcus sp. VKM Ac-2987]